MEVVSPEVQVPTVLLGTVAKPDIVLVPRPNARPVGGAVVVAVVVAAAAAAGAELTVVKMIFFS